MGLGAELAVLKSKPPRARVTANLVYISKKRKGAGNAKFNVQRSI